MKPFLNLPPWKRLASWLTLLCSVTLAVGWVNQENPFSEGGETASSQALVEFPVWESQWIGCEPLTLGEMQGEVWLIKVWTFECINCILSMPFMNDMVERYGERVGMLGVHSPEYQSEREIPGLRAAIVEHELRFPTFVDQTLEFFTAMDVPAWPTFYVVDRELKVRGRWVGEVRLGSKRGRDIEALMEALLEEPLPVRASAQAPASGALEER